MSSPSPTDGDTHNRERAGVFDDHLQLYEPTVPAQRPRFAHTSQSKSARRTQVPNPPVLAQTADAFYREHGATSRPDLAVRRHVRDMIAEVLSTDTDPVNTIEVLELCRAQCQVAGVPFTPLLEEDLDAFGAPPLVVEILRCQWDAEDEMPPVLAYLLSYSSARKLGLWVRKAAILRGDDAIFQRLRPYIPHDTLAPGTLPIDDGEVVEDGTARAFVLRLQVDSFASVMRETPVPARDPAQGKRPAEVSAAAEFIAAGRAWELRVGENALALKLLQGAPADVDAHCVVLARETHELLLPRAVLHPLSASGQHAVVLRPCFSPGWATAGNSPTNFLDPLASLESDELILELHVELGLVPGTSAAGDDSELRDSEWEAVLADGGEAPSGWVKASWSGRDEDL